MMIGDNIGDNKGDNIRDNIGEMTHSSHDDISFQFLESRIREQVRKQFLQIQVGRF